MMIPLEVTYLNPEAVAAVQLQNFIFLVVSIGLITAILVWIDATLRYDPNAKYWALGVFLFALIIVPLYLYHRAYGTTALKERIERQWIRCSYCGEKVSSILDYCSFCDRSLK